MKTIKYLLTAGWLLLSLFGCKSASAQVPVVSIFTGIIKKVIIAIDLKVQELQNETIALQNAEANLENHLHLSGMNDISSWLAKERSLYQQYYQELATVRAVIADYAEVRRMIAGQKQLVSEYHSASTLFHADPHFSAAELQQLDRIYAGILQESVRNIDELLTTVQPSANRMSDAERLAIIHRASAALQTNLDQLRQFNRQNMLLSLGRAAAERDRVAVRTWYGLR